MQIRLGTAQGGATKVYAFTDWRLQPPRAGSISYRPGMPTFLRRLVVTLLAALAIGGAYAYHEKINASSRLAKLSPETERELEQIESKLHEDEARLRKTMTDEEWAMYHRALAETQAGREARIEDAKRRSASLIHNADRVLLIIVGIFTAFGILAPLSCLWQRIAIERDARNNLVVRSFVLFPRTASFPMNVFRCATVLAQELRTSRRALNLPIGWRWRVVLASDGGTIEFWPDHQKDRPAADSVSPRTVEFLQHLQQLTRLPSTRPQLIEYGSGRAGACRTGRTYTTTSEPVVRRQAYRSLDEAPPDLRPRLEQMMAEAKQGGVSSVTRERITIQDSDGNVRTYDSTEDMPPDVRARYEEMRRRFRPG